ncbi:Thermolabile glutaminase [Rubripirellula obstinata]|uniref:Glutaminase n=1 Tax=Rubripirellula obstinata TaxID=406547 RepID=A0A5B1CR39_9BACT|nr:glutaminase [Rubripirellula obstinata]KAA1262319.1 Thermolabile glutaminase [Rubripirellula obstinata]
MDWTKILAEVESVVEPSRGQGRVADYIPALAAIDPNKFGMAVAMADGSTHCIGDADEPFSIQSISKVFTLSMALRKVGDVLWQSVGREPSGSPFNSIVQLEKECGIPRNPLINAGAIVVTDHLVTQVGPEIMIDKLLTRLRMLADDDAILVDQIVTESESEAGSRNRALAYFMKSFDNLQNPVEDTLRAYFSHCAISMNCRQLSRAALFLAFDGTDPVSGTQMVSSEACRRINAVMMSCGHYDNSGDFTYRIGLPGKSGVGGGILVVAPGHGAIAVWSPGLNEAGTSTVGSLALESFVRQTGWTVFV